MRCCPCSAGILIIPYNFPFARQEEKYAKKYEQRFKKELSKQAKIDLAIQKSNSSVFHWEDDL